MKEEHDKLSRWIIYSPLMLMLLLIGIVALSNFAYNALEHTKNTSFQTKLLSDFKNAGASEELIEASLLKQKEHLARNLEKRAFYGFLMIASSVLAVFLFIYILFKKMIKRSLSFEQAFFEEKEKVETMMEELQYVNAQLSSQLYIDTLTQLGNRLALEKMIETMKEPKLILIDVDGFKEINEYYGAHVGDVVLQEIASHLRGFSSEHRVYVYRSGADEFALLEDAPLDIERYEELAIALVGLLKGRQIRTPQGHEIVEITVAIGFSLESRDILEKATIALGEAKKREIDYLCYFRKIESTLAYAEKIKWASFVKEALEKDTVIPYYQPIFDRQGRIVKYECLVRILNDHEEAIPPGLFLNIAKKVKRYGDIEKVLIEKSFKAIAGTSHVISLNLLARDMSDSNISNFVIDCLRHYQVSERVVFEILEEESIESLERVQMFIDRVKRMGSKIAIDDFGTGYSNFSYLLKLKPDYIKIDGSLIRNLEHDTNSVAIVTAIVTFAQKIGIKTIGEYVHTQGAHEKCLELGVDEFQGFYLGEPSARLKEDV